MLNVTIILQWRRTIPDIVTILHQIYIYMYVCVYMYMYTYMYVYVYVYV